MNGQGKLEPCPFCGGEANLSNVGRDWYRITAEHAESCPLEHFELDCPQADDQLPLLLRDWNKRSNRDQLKAEFERLRKDAERYRWLCNGNGYFMEENGLCGHWEDKEAADSEIDEAIAEQAEN